MNLCLIFVFLSWISMLPDPSCAQRRDRELYFPSHYFFAKQRLMNHTIKNVSVKSLDECEYLCYMNDDCVSLNIKNPVGGAHECELNNSTHIEHERDLVPDQFYYYRGAKNNCVKSRGSCKNKATCQSGFTGKGYRCVCTLGYEGEDCGRDIDECAAPVDPCDAIANSVCTNTDGSYTCQCIDGFIKNGLICEADVCHLPKYKVLSDAERKETYEMDTSQCDNTLHGWYRFQRAAGTRMAVERPPLYRCGGSFPGWLSNGHPTVADGIVEKKVCFNRGSGCNEMTTIQVKNCSSYYIYKLSGTPGCNNRYCGTD